MTVVCVLGRTALHWAAAVNNEEAARALIRHHANVDAQDEYNQTAVFLAAREGSYEVAEILLQQGKANADLPDNMERFPRDIALERQHLDIAQLIEKFTHGPGCLSALPLSQAGAASAMMNAQAASGKSRSKKSSTSQRKQSARSVSGNAEREVDGLLRHGRHPYESDLPRHLDRAVPARPKKTTKRSKVPSTSQSVTQSQLQTAASLYHVLEPSEMQLFSPEQPPSYENAINGRRQLAAMQQAANMCPDPHPVYHTGLQFSEPHHFQQTSPDMRYADVMLADTVGFVTQPNGVVLQPSSYLTCRHGEADLSHMVHNSPTVPSCHAYSPQNMSAVQAPEATVVSGGGHHSQSLSPIHRQMLQQKMQRHQSQNPVHHPHQHSHQHLPHPAQPMMADNFDASSSAYVVPASAVLDVSSYALPTPSSATSSTNTFQYPTPPSNHSTTETTSPSLVQQTASAANGYPTPSPDTDTSPGHWSSSSPHSAKSDWSERAAVTNVANQNIKNEPAYL